MTADVPAAVLASVRSTSDRPIPHPRQEPTMTAPAPSPAGLSPLLDQLDEARAKGTPGPWVVDDEYPGVVAAPRTAGVDVADCIEGADDAALIVAAVNALPKLTAALRAVIELADEWDAQADRFLNSDLRRGAYIAAASGVRSALLAALTPGADTAGATA